MVLKINFYRYKGSEEWKNWCCWNLETRRRAQVLFNSSRCRSAIRLAVVAEGLAELTKKVFAKSGTPQLLGDSHLYTGKLQTIYSRWSRQIIPYIANWSWRKPQILRLYTTNSTQTLVRCGSSRLISSDWFDVGPMSDLYENHAEICDDWYM